MLIRACIPPAFLASSMWFSPVSKSSTGFSVVSTKSANIQLKPSESECVSELPQNCDLQADLDITICWCLGEGGNAIALCSFQSWGCLNTWGKLDFVVGRQTVLPISIWPSTGINFRVIRVIRKATFQQLYCGKRLVHGKFVSIVNVSRLRSRSWGFGLNSSF